MTPLKRHHRMGLTALYILTAYSVLATITLMVVL
jgi:hypothetical protein